MYTYVLIEELLNGKVVKPKYPTASLWQRAQRRRTAGKNHFHGGKQTLSISPIEIGNRCKKTIYQGCLRKIA